MKEHKWKFAVKPDRSTQCFFFLFGSFSKPIKCVNHRNNNILSDKITQKWNEIEMKK